MRARPIEEDIWPAPTPRLPRRRFMQAAIVGFVSGATGGWIGRGLWNANTGPDPRKTPAKHPLVMLALEQVSQPPATWIANTAHLCGAIQHAPESIALWDGALAMSKHLASFGNPNDLDHQKAAASLAALRARVEPPTSHGTRLAEFATQIERRLGR